MLFLDQMVLSPLGIGGQQCNNARHEGFRRPVVQGKTDWWGEGSLYVPDRHTRTVLPRFCRIT